MKTNQKIMLYVGIAAVGSVGLILIYRAYKKKAADAVDDITPKDIVTDLKADSLKYLDSMSKAANNIPIDFAKQDARLEAKRTLYEAQWKKSGSTLSFKDWYIENAT